MHNVVKSDTDYLSILHQVLTRCNTILHFVKVTTKQLEKRFL